MQIYAANCKNAVISIGAYLIAIFNLVEYMISISYSVVRLAYSDPE